MQTRILLFWCAVAAVFAGSLSNTVSAQVLYVNTDAAPGGDGQSWERAYVDLQDALDTARTDPTINEIWVAAGLYLPDRGSGDRFASFVLVDAVGLYGGFAGNESERAQRDFEVNKTILSGDLTGNDQVGFVNMEENSYHVVIGSDAGDAAVIDGFMIRGGYADDGAHYSTATGGGLLNDFSGPTVRNCTFFRNAAGSGSGIHNRNGAVTVIENCRFIENLNHIAGWVGGTVSCKDFSGFTLSNSEFVRNEGLPSCVLVVDYSTTEIRGCRFAESTLRNPDRTYNATVYGVNAECTVSDCSFRDNEGYGLKLNYTPDDTPHSVSGCSFVNHDTAIYVSGASSLDCRDTEFSFNGRGIESLVHHLSLTRCTFLFNTSEGNGAGIYASEYYGGGFEPLVQVNGCAFINNTSEASGGAIYVKSMGGGSEVKAINSLFEGNFAFGEGGALWSEVELEALNCIFDSNSSAAGGGALHLVREGNHRINGCTFTARYHGHEPLSHIYVSDAYSLQIANSILWHDPTLEFPAIELVDVTESEVIYNDIFGGYIGEGNIDADPVFVDPNGGDFRLAPGSPCIDAGSSHLFGCDVLTDFAGRLRWMDDRDTSDTGMGYGAIVDMGAHEVDGDVGLRMGCLSSTWADTYTTIEVNHAKPGELVYFVWGWEEGATTIPVCTEQTIAIVDPRLIGWDRADDQGHVSITALVPRKAEGREALFQALGGSTCRVTNLVRQTFR